MNVLIIEDDKNIANLERLAISSMFDEIDMAYTGEQATEILERKTYDLILLDIMLPDKTGYDISSYIRMDPRHKATKIVMVSAKSTNLDVDKGMLIGADDYVTKPFEIPELIHVINNVLSS